MSFFVSFLDASLIFFLLGIETWISTRNGISLCSFNLSKSAKVISTGSASPKKNVYNNTTAI